MDEATSQGRFCLSQPEFLTTNSNAVLNVSTQPPSTDALESGWSLSYYLSGPLLLGFTILGIFGNVICLYVLSRPKRRPRVNVYLLTLAGWDWILVASSFFVYNLPTLSAGAGHSVWEWSVYVHALPFWYAIAAMAQACSIWVMICLAVERYFALCHPLKHRLWWSGSWLRRILLFGISFTGVVYCLPRLFETRIDECIDRDTGKAVLTIAESTLQNNAYYRLWYKTIGGMALFSVGPTVILLVLSIRVALAMKSRGLVLEGRGSSGGYCRKRKPARASNGDCVANRASCCDVRIAVDSPYNTNTMLIVVVVKFLLCHSLPAVLDVSESTMGDGFEHSSLIDILVDASNALVVFNSSCNVIIYYSCSHRFRYEVFRCLSTLAGKCTFRKATSSRVAKSNKGTTEELKIMNIMAGISLT